MSTLAGIDEFSFSSSVVEQVTEPLILDESSDHALIEATRLGDESAFALLVARYRSQITNYVYRILNDYDTAVDLAQETFVRVFQAAGRYKSTYAFSTYIYRIATNLAISELRKRKRRRLVSLTGFFQGRDGAEPQEFNPPDLKQLQDAAMVTEERRAAVARAIGSLPERYRAALVLRDVEGKSYEDIAAILELSDGTVKSRISRARGLLKDKLRAYI